MYLISIASPPYWTRDHNLPNGTTHIYIYVCIYIYIYVYRLVMHVAEIQRYSLDLIVCFAFCWKCSGNHKAWTTSDALLVLVWPWPMMSLNIYQSASGEPARLHPNPAGTQSNDLPTGWQRVNSCWGWLITNASGAGTQTEHREHCAPLQGDWQRVESVCNASIKDWAFTKRVQPHTCLCTRPSCWLSDETAAILL